MPGTSSYSITQIQSYNTAYTIELKPGCNITSTITNPILNYIKSMQPFSLEWPISIIRGYVIQTTSQETSL